MTRREQVAALLAQGPATFPEIVSALGVTRQRACGFLAVFVQSGAIERSGERRRYVYNLPVDESRAGVDLQSIWR